MADTTPTPSLHPILTGYIAWIKAHEKLLIIVLAAFLTFHFYGSALTAWVNHDKRLADIAQQKAQADQTTNQKFETELVGLRVQLDQITKQTNANIQQRQQQTTNQKQKNNQDSSSEVATRIVQILRVQPQEVTASPIDGTLVFSSGAAHSNVNALEDGQAAQQNVTDLTNQNVACTAVVNKDEQLIAGLNLTLTDQQVASTKALNEEKANSKKQYWRGFKHGYLAGVITAVVIKVAKIL